jgi:hypothetical protein
VDFSIVAAIEPRILVIAVHTGRGLAPNPWRLEGGPVQSIVPAALRAPAPAAKAALGLSSSRPCFQGRAAMIAIGVILIFIIAIGALNFYEFGRLD